MKDRNVFFTDGAAGIYLLLKACNEKEENIPFNVQDFYEKIIYSEIWNLLEKNQDFFEKHAGLDGYCGLIMLLDYMENQYKCK